MKNLNEERKNGVVAATPQATYQPKETTMVDNNSTDDRKVNINSYTFDHEGVIKWSEKKTLEVIRKEIERAPNAQAPIWGWSKQLQKELRQHVFTMTGQIAYHLGVAAKEGTDKEYIETCHWAVEQYRKCVPVIQKMYQEKEVHVAFVNVELARIDRERGNYFSQQKAENSLYDEQIGDYRSTVNTISAFNEIELHPFTIKVELSHELEAEDVEVLRPEELKALRKANKKEKEQREMLQVMEQREKIVRKEGRVIESAMDEAYTKSTAIYPSVSPETWVYDKADTTKEEIFELAKYGAHAVMRRMIKPLKANPAVISFIEDNNMEFDFATAKSGKLLNLAVKMKSKTYANLAKIRRAEERVEYMENQVRITDGGVVDTLVERQGLGDVRKGFIDERKAQIRAGDTTSAIRIANLEDRIAETKELIDKCYKEIASVEGLYDEPIEVATKFSTYEDVPDFRTGFVVNPRDYGLEGGVITEIPYRKENGRMGRLYLISFFSKDNEELVDFAYECLKTRAAIYKAGVAESLEKVIEQARDVEQETEVEELLEFITL